MPPTSPASSTLTQQIIVERAMYLSGRRAVDRGHASAGVTALGNTWLLAEGATGPFFDTYLLIANPETTAATLRFTYLLADGRTVERLHTVAARGRLTVYAPAEDPLLRAATFSAVVDSTNGVRVLVERAMWWPAGQPWYEGHAVSALTAGAPAWAVPFVDVDPAAGRESFVLVGNPSGASVPVTLTILGAQTVTRTLTIPPSSRTTLSATGLLDGTGGTSGGVIIRTDGADVVVEHASYANAGAQLWSAGSATPATRLP